MPHLVPPGFIKTLVRTLAPTPLSEWWEGRHFEKYGEIELLFLPYLCDRKRVAVDVGVNDGCYTLFMRKHALHVHAFEPVPWLATRLVRRFPDVTVYPLALSNTAGMASLHIPIIGESLVTGLSTLSPITADNYAEDHVITVQTLPLDQLDLGDIGFIKIDVEGHEQSVLEGALETISRYRPRLLVEIEERHAPAALERIKQMLTVLGYQGYFAYQGDIFPIDIFDPSMMQRPADIAGFGNRQSRRDFPFYINNFLFLPIEEAETVRTALNDALLKFMFNPPLRLL